MCDKFGIASVGEDIWYKAFFVLLKSFLQLSKTKLDMQVTYRVTRNIFGLQYWRLHSPH